MEVVAQDSSSTAVSSERGTNCKQHLSAQITVGMLTLGKDIFMHKLFCRRNITGSETARLSVMRMSSAFSLVTAAFVKEENISSDQLPTEVNKKNPRKQVAMAILKGKKKCRSCYFVETVLFVLENIEISQMT